MVATVKATNEHDAEKRLCSKASSPRRHTKAASDISNYAAQSRDGNSEDVCSFVPFFKGYRKPILLAVGMCYQTSDMRSLLKPQSDMQAVVSDAIKAARVVMQN